MNKKEKQKTIVLDEKDMVNIALVYHAMFEQLRSSTFTGSFLKDDSAVKQLIRNRFNEVSPDIKKQIKLILAIYKNPFLFSLVTFKLMLTKKQIKNNPLVVIKGIEKNIFKPIKSKMKTFEMFIIDCIICQYDNLESLIMNIPEYKFQNDFIQRLHAQIPLLEPKKNQDIKADIVIVGSGAGGAVAAAILSQKGFKVIVIEKGKYKDRRDFSMNEGDAKELFESSGIIRSKKKDLFMLCGKNLGGGSLIGWTSSFETPTIIRNQWDKYSGLDGMFSSQEFSNSMKVISKTLNVNQFSSFIAAKERKLVDGLEKIGYNTKITPRNVEQCSGESCGFCIFGCKKGNKKSVLETWHRTAANNGVLFCTETFVSSIKMDNDKATGILVEKNGDQFVIEADTVILSAGALATPTILQRSKINLPQIGKNLAIHPTALVAAKFDDPVYPWKGTPQAIYCDDELYRDQDHYGYLIQSAPLHPGLFLSWIGIDSTKIRNKIINEFSHWAGATVMLADRGNGVVKSKSNFDLEWSYSLTRPDKNNMKHGICQTARAFYQAGAKEIILMSNAAEHWERGKEPFERFLRRLEWAYITKSTVNFGSTHQMGTAKIGQNPQTSVCNKNGLVHGLKNVYVMDASLLPRSSAVPPEVSIQTVVHILASRLANELEKKSRIKTQKKANEK